MRFFKWHDMKVTNSSGTEVGSSSTTTLTLSGLADGTYYFMSSETGTGWNPNPRAYARYYTNISFSFKVDSTKPTLSGASTSTTGKYVKGSFTVYASDSMSGIKALFYKTPNSSYYQSTTSTSKNFPSGSANGLYSFYAVDNAGNQSSTYYVVYDSTVPTGVIRSSSGTTLTSQYTNSAFYYTATDASSGISYLQYKTPSSSSWLTYTSGTNIPATSANGKYTFRAVDKAGNTSEEKSIYLDTTKPVGTLYGGTSIIASGGSTNASSHFQTNRFNEFLAIINRLYEFGATYTDKASVCDIFIKYKDGEEEDVRMAIVKQVIEREEKEIKILSLAEAVSLFQLFVYDKRRGLTRNAF